MSEYTTLPFGPQHPVLPEPLQFKLKMDDERIVEAIPAIGYVHRGLERLIQVRDFSQMVYVVERVCGICSVMHAQTYCQGIEELMGIQVPDRARYLRVVWAELHRIHSHLLALGLLADSFGFESLFMHTWRIRERILDMLEATTGHRILISINIIGGTRRDLSTEQIAMLRTELDTVQADFREVERVFVSEYTIRHRLVGVGVLTKEQAYELGCVGPTARGSGLAQDLRQLGYAAYGELGFEPVVQTDGDSFARMHVRTLEVHQSIELVRRALDALCPSRATQTARSSRGWSSRAARCSIIYVRTAAKT
jgi:ech hydrogenase subunit E